MIQNWGLSLISQAGVHRFAFEGQDAEDALVDATEGLAADEAFEGLDAQGELAECEGSLRGEAE